MSSQQKPRIYIAIATFHPLIGGAEKQALMQAQRLRERGIATTVMTFHHDPAWQKREEVTGVPVIRVAGKVLHKRETRPRLLQKILYLLAMATIGWSLWQHRHHYDIVHVYQLNIIALPCALACWLARKRIIVAIRSTNGGKTIDDCRTLQAGTLDSATPCLQMIERVRIGNDIEDLQRMGKPVVKFTHWLLCHIHAVPLVLSSRMEDYLVTHHFTMPDVQRIPNGVDTTHFTPSDNIRDWQTPTVVCVARLSYEKGVDVLLHAWHIVHANLPHTRLVIIGDGPLRQQLNCMAELLGIAASITFAGASDDIPAHLQQAAIAVLPSRWEGMPNALLEAMACGLPCVATKVSGSEDILQHGTNGLLVENEDYTHMAEAICALLTHPAFARQCGQAARVTIEHHYTLERIIDRYEQLYLRMMGMVDMHHAEERITTSVRHSRIY